MPCRSCWKTDTEALSKQPIISRAVSSSGVLRRSRISEQKISGQVRDIARRVKGKKEYSSEEVRFAEEAIMGAIMGQSSASRLQPPLKSSVTHSKREKPIPLHIEVVRGDVTQIKAPVVVVGHYKGVAPVNAEGAIDKALGIGLPAPAGRG